MSSSRDELSTIIQRPFDPTPPPSESYRLVAADGVDRGRSLTVDDNSPGRVYAGAAADCELQLADRAVSRRHFAVELHGAWLRLSDLDSTNGTFVNGVRVQGALLEGGETIRVGSTALSVERGPAVPSTLSRASAFGRMRGASREMRRLYPLCDRLAASDVPVVIEGETGTGKEVLAECIHEAGRRAAAPFVVLDCTAIPPNLVESVLFGHERGAFTGATGPHVGVFEEADGGTLFIDEIGDLDLAMQPRLLRALERSEVRRVGGSKTMKFDVRVLAATRRSLDAEIEAGRFRDDLFHRLAVARIELPPLRARRGDVGLLVAEFCAQHGADPKIVPRSLLAGWERADWPGNVRELRNAVARLLALGDPSPFETFETGEAPPPDRDAAAGVLAKSLPFLVARQKVLDDFERRYVEQVLAAHGGNVSQAARASGLARRNFQILRDRAKKTGR
jgi:DNA-binding NtrC family response regulator